MGKKKSRISTKLKMEMEMHDTPQMSDVARQDDKMKSCRQ